MIQAALNDVVRQCAIAGVEVIKVTGTTSETLVQTFDTDKTLFIEGRLIDPVPEFEGEFGITNLKMLSGLLGVASYQTDSADFRVRTREIAGAKVLDQFEFKGSETRSVFKLMDVQHVPQQAKITAIPWSVTLDEGLSKAKLSEFQQFAGLYSEIDKQFSVVSDGSNLIANFGRMASSTHSGSMMLATGIEGRIAPALTFPFDKFLMLMKLLRMRNHRR